MYVSVVESRRPTISVPMMRMNKSPTIVIAATARERIIIRARCHGLACLSAVRLAPQRLQNLSPSEISEPHAQQNIPLLYQIRAIPGLRDASIAARQNLVLFLNLVLNTNYLIPRSSIRMMGFSRI